MADFSPARDRWAFRPIPPEPRSIVELIRAGTLDAELAAQLWLLIEARVPIVVAAGPQGVGKTTLLGALLAFVPPSIRSSSWPVRPRRSPGCRRRRSSAGRASRDRPQHGDPVRPERTILLAHELSNHLPAYTWGEAARVAVRAASIGYGLAATIHADSLDDVFDALRRPPVRLTDDELSHLGVVVVLRRVDGGRRRVVAAHYVRPVARDLHGHTQRLGPAVLATWDPATDGFEHFGWGVTPELATRIGRRAGDFEIEQDRRRDYLDHLVAAGVTAPDAVRDAIRAYRPAVPFDAPRDDA